MSVRRNNFHSISNLHHNWDQMEINFNFEIQNNNNNQVNNSNQDNNSDSDSEQFDQVSISEIETEVFV